MLPAEHMEVNAPDIMFDTQHIEVTRLWCVYLLTCRQSSQINEGQRSRYVSSHCIGTGGDKGKYMILKRLKLATRESHIALERQLPLMNSDLARDEYRQFVSRFLGFYAPLERQLLAAPYWKVLAFDYSARQKTPRLKQDLFSLGSSADLLALTPHCTELPVLTTPEQLLGCLYVIEGATLGGRVITRHLQRNLGLTPQSGGAFFDGYGTETGANWKAFCTMLSRSADHSGDEGRKVAIVAGANRTFETLTHWLFPTSSRVTDDQ
jgi:heme oxygenase